MTNWGKSYQQGVHHMVDEFLMQGPVEQQILTLDGTGVNGSIQYIVLSRIGLDRLKQFKVVNVLSASTYAYLCFLGMAEGYYKWNQDSARGWDRFNRKCHGIKSFWSIAKTIASSLSLGRPLSNEGFLRALEGTLDKSFTNRTVSELPSNVRIWLYEESERNFVPACSQSSLKHLKLTDIIRAAPAVPRIFAPYQADGKTYSDPVYAPTARKLYQTIRSETCSAHLFSNIRKHDRKDHMFYVRPHPYRDGDRMVLKDLGLFLANLPNPAVYAAMDAGLYWRS